MSLDLTHVTVVVMRATASNRHAALRQKFVLGSRVKPRATRAIAPVLSLALAPT